MAESARETLTIAAAPAAVLRVMTDYEDYPQWQPSVTAAEVASRDDAGRPDLVRFDLNLRITTATIVLQYTYLDDALRWHLVSGRGVRAVDGAYELVDRRNGSTEVTYSTAVELTISVPWLVLRQARATLVREQLHGLKTRVESMAP